MAVLVALGLDVPNFTKDVPRVQKCNPRRGTIIDHFFMGS